MFIQHVLKGIEDIGDTAADEILLRSGLVCNWWRSVGRITQEEISAKLTEDAIDWHLNRYTDVDPATNLPFCDNTPFISTTAGTAEQHTGLAYFQTFPPFLTALQFATSGYTRPGYIFYAYIFALGKKAIGHAEFSEETRDLHIYTGFQRFHPEGEIVAKIVIPSGRLERWEYYEPATVLNALQNGQDPQPTRRSAPNPAYQPPDRIHNIRPLMT